MVFVGTKRRPRKSSNARRPAATCPYVSERWLGGTLTNYRTIRDRLKRLEELEAMWLPAGEKPDKLDMAAYMKSMIDDSGKLDLHQGPRNGPIRTLQEEDGRHALSAS